MHDLRSVEYVSKYGLTETTSEFAVRKFLLDIIAMHKDEADAKHMPLCLNIQSHVPVILIGD